MYDPTNHPRWGEPTLEPPAQPAPKKRNKAAIIALAIIAGLLALCCGIGGVATLASHSTKKASDTHVVAPSPSATQLAGVVPATPAATEAAAKPSPTKPAPPTVAQQIRAWFDGGGEDRLTALSNAMGEVQRTSLAGDLTGVKRAALGLGVAVKAAQAYAPLPDADAQHFWHDALEQFGVAAKAMYVGVETDSPSQLQKGVEALDQGNVDIQLLSARVNTLRG